MSLWLYRRALGLAYFNDDPTGHFAWMEGRSVADFFSGAAAYGYYRPVVFTVLRLFETLFGGGDWPHNPFADHALLLLLHAANAALVWALAWRLAGRGPGRAAFAGVAALIFAAQPFSYEAVAYVASLTHPLLVFWLLSALLLYERGIRQEKRNAERRGEARRGAEEEGDRGEKRDTELHGDDTERHRGRKRVFPPRLSSSLRVSPRRSSLAPGPWPLAPFLLALLTHENGLFVVPALVGVDWLRRPGDSPRVRLRRLWPYGVVAALYLALWLAIPKNSSQGFNSPAGIASNAVPFLQSLVFPLLSLLRLSAGDVAALVGMAAALVAGVGLLAWRAGGWRLWLFALGWVGLSALPSLLFLGPAYVYGSPRLSYLPGVGIGLLWGIPVLWVARVVRNRVSSEKHCFYGVLALAAIYLVGLLLPARPFVTCQLDFYDETSRLAREMGRIGQTAPAGQAIVFTNAPFFFSSMPARPDGCPSPYPWTPTGGILIPPYAQARDFVRFNGGPEREATGVSFAGYAPGWRTFGPEIDGAGLRAAVAGNATYVFDLGRGFTDLSAGWRPGEASGGPALATFGDTLALAGGAAVATGNSVHAQLDWRVLARPAFLPAVFVHVYDAAGALAAQSDGPPADGFAPVDLWEAGDGLSDTRLIDVSGLPPGEYTIAAGVYNPADGARLPAERNGQRLAGDVLPLGTFVR